MHSQRPTSLTIIGWSFLINSSFSILTGGSILTIVMSAGVTGKNLMPMLEVVPIPFKDFWVLYFRNIGVLALLHVGIGIFVFVTSLHFLNFRAWARTVLEIISWLSITLNSGFGIFWYFTWNDASNWIQFESLPVLPAPLPLFGGTLGGIKIIFFAVFHMTIIILLRGKTIRAAVN